MLFRSSALEIANKTNINNVYSKLLPKDKLDKLKKIRKSNGEVMFIGDGINDALVLSNADVSASMGSGSDAAMENSDIIFMNSNMSAIPLSIKIAKKTNLIAWQNIYFAIIVKVLIMVLGFLGFASMWLAVFADTGVAILCILNSIRILLTKSNIIRII